jgi:hypothetical protein
MLLHYPTWDLLENRCPLEIAPITIQFSPGVKAFRPMNSCRQMDAGSVLMPKAGVAVMPATAGEATIKQLVSLPLMAMLQP